MLIILDVRSSYLGSSSVIYYIVCVLPFYAYYVVVVISRFEVMVGCVLDSVTSKQLQVAVKMVTYHCFMVMVSVLEDYSSSVAYHVINSIWYGEVPIIFN